MKKKLLMIVMAMVLCFALAACGGGGDKEKDDGIDPNATVTKEQYDKLGDSKWYEMSPEEMEQFLGVKYVEDEESAKDWGDAKSYDLCIDSSLLGIDGTVELLKDLIRIKGIK